MSNSINLLSNDITGYVFGFLENKQKLVVSCVNKEWHEIASQIVRLSYLMKIDHLERELNQKMSSYLKMTGNTINDYCSLLQDIRNTKEKYSLPTAFEISDCLDHFVNRYEVSFGECFQVDLKSLTPVFNKARINKTILQVGGLAFIEEYWPGQLKKIPIAELSNMLSKESRANEFFSKPFVSLNLTCDGYHTLWSEKLLNPDQTDEERAPGDSCVMYFPIELFNLKVEGKDCQLVGEKTQGNYCFPLKGRMVEFIIIPEPAEEVRAPRLSAQRNPPSLSHVPLRSLEGIPVSRHTLAPTESFYDPVEHAFEFEVEEIEPMQLG